MAYLCHNCGYDLSGGDRTITTCPECGAVRAADVDALAAARPKPRAHNVTLKAATCSECGHSLRGLTVKHGVVTCPECGSAEIFALPAINAPARIDIRKRMRRGCLLALLAAIAFALIALVLI